MHVHGVDRAGREVLRRRVKRAGFSRLLRELEPCVVAMEACGGTHCWGRLSRRFGHAPRLTPPAYVKGYLTRNRNDRRDADAVREAAQRPKLNQHWVAVKTLGEQEWQLVHRVRRQVDAFAAADRPGADGDHFRDVRAGLAWRRHQSQ